MSGLKTFKNNIRKTIHGFELSSMQIVGGFLNQGNISTFQTINWDSYQLKPIIVSSIIINILELSSPLYINILYTSILPSESVSSLIVLTGIVITLMLINGWLKSLRLSLTGDGGAKIDHKKRLEAMSHFLQINLDDFFSLSPTQHSQRLTAISLLKDESSLQALTTAIDLIFSILFIIVLFMIGGAVGFAAIVGIFIYLIKAKKYSEEYEERSRSRELTDLQTRSFQNQVNDAADLIRANGLQQKLIVESEYYLDRRAQERLRQNYQSGVFQAFSSLTGQITFATGVTLGALLVITENLSVGALAASILLLGKILSPWQQAINLLNSYRRLSHSRDEYKSLISIPLDEEKGDQLINNWEKVNIHKNNGLSIEVEKGNLYVINDNKFGEKTREFFMEISSIKESKNIFINDIKVKDYSKGHLKEKIVYVDPSRSFFKGTLMDNLTSFQPKKNRRRALFWSMLSGLDEEVRELPHGYGTEIEYNQSKILSQDVEAIAQIVTALSLNPKILLIDLLNCSYGQYFVDSLRKILKRCEFDKIVMIGGSGPVFNRLTNNTIYLQETSKEVLQ